MDMVLQDEVFSDTWSNVGHLSAEAEIGTNGGIDLRNAL